MPYRSTQESLQALYGVALTQGGYFTAKQAAETGYDYPHIAYHLPVGNFERAGHGLYRLPTIPVAEHDDFIRLALWSRDRQDVPQAVVSHESALLIHGLGDLLPHRIHMTVPPTFRKPPPAGCVLHRARLDSGEIEPREGFSVTTPLRALIDVAAGAAVSDEQLAKAVEEAVQQGLVRASALKQARAHGPGAARLDRVSALSI